MLKHPNSKDGKGGWCSRWASRKVVMKQTSFFDAAPRVDLSPFSKLLVDHENKKKQRLSQGRPVELNLDESDGLTDSVLEMADGRESTAESSKDRESLLKDDLGDYIDEESDDELDYNGKGRQKKPLGSPVYWSEDGDTSEDSDVSEDGDVSEEESDISENGEQESDVSEDSDRDGDDPVVTKVKEAVGKLDMNSGDGSQEAEILDDDDDEEEDKEEEDEREEDVMVAASTSGVAAEAMVDDNKTRGSNGVQSSPRVHAGVTGRQQEKKKPLPRQHHHDTPTIRFAGGQDCPVINSPLIEYMSPAKKKSLSVQQKTLALCNQKTFLSIDEFFTPIMRSSAKKLGEGVFGEVFSSYTDKGESLAIKIMPIDGKEKINDERQKTFEEILPEMVISQELSNLGKDENAKYFTKNFVQLHRMGICRGVYPYFLLEAWDTFDEEEESDNDRPDIFPHNQLFVLFAFQNSGHALESFVFHTQREARSVLAQIAGTLAVGEAALGFEHRDMHRGNVLVKRTRETEMVFVIDSVRYVIPSEGVKVSIIDYTLSRIQQGDCISYNDLNNLPWLFEGKEGLQHQTYLHMRNCTGGEWSKFAPKTNAYWLHYIVNRMAIKSKVKNLNRRHIYAALRVFIDKFPKYDSAKQIFLENYSKFVPDSPR